MITNLIFIEFAVFELSLSLLSKCNDDKTHKYVHHEEGDNDDVDNEKDGDFYSVVVNGASIYGVGIDGPVQKPLGKNKIKETKQVTHRIPDTLSHLIIDIRFLNLCYYLEIPLKKP